MKKTIFLLIIIAFAVKGNAECKFYTNNGATLITETKCGDNKDITVTIPVPANVSKFDMVSVKVSLSTLSDVQAKYEFNKNEIQSKLVGKKTVSLLLISADGNSTDFSFPEGSGLNNNDL